MRQRIVLVTLVLIWEAAFGQSRPARKGQTSRPFSSGPCRPAESSFDQTARATGGQVYRLRPSEMDKMGVVMQARLANDSDTVLLANGALGRGEAREFGVPLDSTVTKLILAITVECKAAIQVWRPSGEAVGAGGAAGMENTELIAGRILTVQAPEAGPWRVQISGWGAFSVDARVVSAISFDRFAFVRRGGRPGHEGLFPIPGEPLAGQQHMGEAEPDGPVRSPRFLLVSEAGDPIRWVTLAPGHPDAAAGDFVGVMDLPAEPFRVALEGTDERGLTARRVFQRLFHLKTIEVTANARENVAAGATAAVSFTVRNLGPPGRFRVVIVDTLGLMKGADAPVVDLATGAAVSVEAEVAVPAGARAGTDLLVIATATSTTDPQSTNGATAALTVGP